VAEHQIEMTYDDLSKLTSEVTSEQGPGEATKAFNQRMVEDFRSNKGVPPGEFADAPILLITMTRARSGKTRTVPLGYARVDGRLVVIASRGGSPDNPVWYDDIVTNDEVVVELGGETFAARPVVLEGVDRDQAFAGACETLEFMAGYQKLTTRVLPVVELVPVG